MFNKQQLICGAVETYTGDDVSVTMWYEGGVYHVEARELDTRDLIASKLFHKLTEARAKFNRYCEIAHI